MPQNRLHNPRTFTCACGKTVTGRIRTGDDSCLECHLKTNPKFPRTGVETPCKWCGNWVYLTRSAYQTSGHIFCSKEHSDEWWRRGKVTLNCKICNKPRTEAKSHARRYVTSYCSMDCRRLDPAWREQLHQASLKQETVFESSVEKMGYTLLDSAGIPYVRQHSINGRFIVDAFVVESRVVLEFDGDYWHGNPARYRAPGPRQIRQMGRDKARDAYLAACGYRVIRFWESDMKHKVDEVLSRLRLIQETP